MKRKLLAILAGVMIPLMLFAGCGNSSQTSSTSKTQNSTQSQTESDESEESTLHTSTVDNGLAGVYYETTENRARADVDLEDNGKSASIFILYSVDSDNYITWELTASIDGDTLTYTNCERNNVVVNKDGEAVETLIYKSGCGTFTMDGDAFTWHPANDPDAEGFVFEKSE